MCILTLGFAIAEVLTGIFTNSLALLSDAMHMFSDLISLIIGFIAIQVRCTSSTSLILADVQTISQRNVQLRMGTKRSHWSFDQLHILDRRVFLHSAGVHTTLSGKARFVLSLTSLNRCDIVARSWRYRGDIVAIVSYSNISTRNSRSQNDRHRCWSWTWSQFNWIDCSELRNARS